MCCKAMGLSLLINRDNKRGVWACEGLKSSLLRQLPTTNSKKYQMVPVYWVKNVLMTCINNAGSSVSLQRTGFREIPTNF